MSKLCVNFFDASNPSKTIHLEENTKVEAKVGDIVQSLALKGKNEKEPQHIELPNPFMKDVKDAIEAHSKHQKKQDPRKDDFVMEVRLQEPYQEGCKRYTSPTVTLLAKDAIRECCCVPVPLYASPEACSITLRAYDASFDDYIKNAKEFENEVEWTIESVEAPSIPSQHGSAYRFQPWTSSARSENARAVISDVPLHQLYRIEARGPDGYRTEGSAIRHRYICCEQSISITTYFRPCTKQPTRSLIFVHEECPGSRWGQNETVNIGGHDLTVGADGILKLPTDLAGVCTLCHPLKAFSPSVVNVESASTVSVIAVSDQVPAGQMLKGQTVRAQVLDQDDNPFKRRPVVFMLPDGSEVRTMTDDTGCFEGRHGAKFYFPEHVSGPAKGSAIEPLLLITTESE